MDSTNNNQLATDPHYQHAITNHNTYQDALAVLDNTMA